MNHTSSHRSSARCAFTLVEAAVSIVIVGVMLTAALSMLGGAAQARRRTAAWRESESLARSLMCEVQQCAYGSTSGPLITITLGVATDREGFATIDDYKGFAEQPPRSRSGTLLTGYTGWNRAVDLERVDPGDPTGAPRTGSSDTGLKRLVVTVIAPTGQRTTMTALRSRWGLAEASASRTGAMLSALDISLNAGLGVKTLYTSLTVPNRPGEGARVTVATNGSVAVTGATASGSTGGKP